MIKRLLIISIVIILLCSMITNSDDTDKENKDDLSSIDDENWYVETIDNVGDTLEYDSFPSIAIDSNGYIHISYNIIEESVNYVYWNGFEWTFYVIDTLDYGFSTSIAVDSNDYPHFCYCDFLNCNLKYAYWDGANWTIQVVDSDGLVGLDCSIAVDSNDYPHFCYYDLTNEDLKYAYWDGANWTIQVVDNSGNVGRFTSIALDDSNHPHISYYDSTRTALKYAHWNGTNWKIEIIDNSDVTGYHTSIALDNSDYPHISYVNLLYEKLLKYAHWNGTNWKIEIIANEVYGPNSIALNHDDCPYISYFDVSYNNLKISYWNGTIWTIDSINGSYDSIYENSLDLDSNDNPHICFIDEDNSELLFAKRMSNQPPVADFDYWYIFPDINQTINFTDTSYDPVGSIVDWYWDFGDGTTSTLQHPSHNYSTAGVYNVGLTVTDNDGVSDTHSKLIPIGIEELYLLNDVYSGWNFFSISFNDSFDKNDLLLRIGSYFYDVGYLFGWNRISQSYEFADILYPGYGYWLYSIDDGDILAVDINPNNGTYITTVEEGWNIVGIPDNFPFPVDKMDILVDNISWNTAVSNGWISDVLFDWDEQGQSYAFSDAFLAFEAYWLYSYKECVLKLNN